MRDLVSQAVEANAENIARLWATETLSTRKAAQPERASAGRTQKRSHRLPLRSVVLDLARALVVAEAPGRGPAALEHARRYGTTRQHNGATLAEVVTDFAALRQLATTSVVNSLPYLNGNLLEAILRMSQGVDKLIAAATEAYHAAATEALAAIVSLDPMTGLFNHGYFWQRLDEELARAARHDRPLSLIMIDIDDFKAVNDRFGHLYGDMVLKHLATTLQGERRRSDVVARYGGEEFAMILPETTLDGAHALAERIRYAFEAHTFRGAFGEPVVLTVSVGCADHHPDLSPRDLVARADRAMYAAKGAGTNRVVSYTEDMVCLLP